MASVCGVLVASVLLSVAVTGCATIEPWERGNLAKPHMALDPNGSRTAMRTHTYVSREAAAGGNTAQGGGCGCQ